jgi:hypothetical protein
MQQQQTHDKFIAYAYQYMQQGTYVHYNTHCAYLRYNSLDASSDKAMIANKTTNQFIELVPAQYECL